MLEYNGKIITKIERNNKVIKTIANSQNKQIHTNCTVSTDSNAAYSKSVPDASLNLARLTTIGGKSMVWNQYIPNAETVITNNAVIYFPNGTRIVEGHKYYLSVTAENWNADSVLAVYGKTEDGLVHFQVQKTNDYRNIATSTFSGVADGAQNIGSAWAYVYGNSAEAKTYNIRVIDLTQMYGAGNEPTTTSDSRIAEIEAYATLHPEYNSGEIVSAKVDKVVSEGKNLAKLDNTYNDAADKFTYSNYSTDEVSGTISTNSNNFPVVMRVYLEKGKKYKLSYSEASDNIVDVYIYKNKTWGELIANGTKYLSAFTWDKNSGWYTHAIYFRFSTDLHTFMIKNIQFEVGDSATSYTPYRSPIDYPIPSEVQALDGYGWSAGSVYNYIDFAEKKFHKKVDRLNLGELTWQNYERESDPFKYAVVANIGDGTETSIFTDNYIRVIQVFNSGILRARYKNGTIMSDTPNPTGMVYFAMNEEVVTDISSYLTDSAINVEGGGKLTFKQGESWMWNQLADQFTTDDSIVPIRSGATITQNHKYLFMANIPSGEELYFYVKNSPSAFSTTNKFYIWESAETVTADGRYGSGHDSIWFYRDPNKTADIIAMVDLTTLYGAGNEPTDVTDPRIAEIEAYARLHPEYNAGQNVYFDRTEFVVPNSEKFFVTA